MSTLDQAIHLLEKDLNTPVFSIRPIEGEHDNDLFLANLGLVVRITKPNETDAEFIKKNNEFAFYKFLANKNIVVPIPAFIYYNSNNDKVDAYIDGQRPTMGAKATLEMCEDIINSIVALHAIEVPNITFDPFDRFWKYKKLAKNPLPKEFEAQIVAGFKQIYDARPLVLSHNAIGQKTILLTPEGVAFTDSSWIGRNAPIYDLACMVSGLDLESTLSRKCLSRFCSLSLESPYSYEELETTVAFVDALSYYYSQARFHETKQKRFSAEARRRKKRFLFRFEAHLMEGDE